MKLYGWPALAITLGMCLPNLAYAYCPGVSTYSRGFEDQVSQYIDHLLCLHNEQVGSLNEHARLINQLGDEIDGLRRGSSQGETAAYTGIVREVVVKYSAMEAENKLLREHISDLEARLERVEGLTEDK